MRLLIAVSCSLPIHAKNNTSIQLIKNQDSYSTIGYISYLEDPKHTLDLPSIISAHKERKFIYAGEKLPNFGFSQSTYWFHLAIENINSDYKNWLIEVKDPVIDLVDMYFVDSLGETQHMQMGDNTSIDNRPIKIRTPLFKLNLESNKKIDVFIKIRTAGPIRAGIKIWSQDAYTKHNSNAQILYGIFYGGSIALLLYNLMLFFSTKDTVYFFYCLFVGFNTFSLSLGSGLPYEYFWPNNGKINIFVTVIFGNLLTIFIIQFARAFLQTKKKFKRLDRTMLYAMFISPAPLLLLLIGDIKNALTFNLLLSTFSALLAFSVGIVALHKNVQEARYYLIAWATFIIAILVVNLSTVGLLPAVFFVRNAVYIGSALEAILLSFALAHRMSLLKEENYRIQKEAAETLELRVEERTGELKAAMDKLGKANILLKENSYNDGLTGVRNRGYFDEHFEIEWLRCRRDKKSIALLMIDIDHFKHINDDYGHLCGDYALICLADTLKQIFKRPNDIVARYGGEEFVVVLPNTSTESARFLAERIRRNLENQTLIFNDQKFILTVSIGCTSIVPNQNDLNPNDLINKADKALYAAKDTGRNRVHSIL